MIIEKDIDAFLEVLKSKAPYDWNIDNLKEVAKGVIFYKYFESSLPDDHYLNSLIQDALTILDSLTHKSERYFHFILRSYIENYMRVMLFLKGDDSMGIMKLIGKCKKETIKYLEAPTIFNEINKQYDECCLHVHSNIKTKAEISVYLKRIIERNDFQDAKNINSALEKFLKILNNSITLLLICRTDSVDSSFYRNKDTLKRLIGQDRYSLFTSALKDEFIVITQD